ncbi:MAG: hypothetical protein H8D97_01195 [Proteobacteria bacterium]|nr:hypothetical protein [Pseudomonadota bacterium]
MHSDILSSKDYFNSMRHIIKLVIGDCSRKDGHNMHENILIKSNLNKIWIDRAYEEASAILGFCFIEEVATEYEEPIAPKYVITKLRKAFNEPNLLMSENDNDRQNYYINTEQYLDSFLKIIKLGHPEFKYKFINHDEYIMIGGYGLFSKHFHI